MRFRATALIPLAILCLTAPVSAHEIRPGYLELDEFAPGLFNVTWKVPARGNAVLRLNPVFSAAFRDITPRAESDTGTARLYRWQMRLDEGGGVPASVSIEGIEKTLTDVLLRIRRRDGTDINVLLSAARPTYELSAENPAAPARGYFGLGVEHILTGPDHLLFVLMILLLLGSAMDTIKTVTAFTIAHSITLGSAVLGFVNVPPAPVETLIALSIIIVASEVLHRASDRPSMTRRRPWVVAFIFGLLHGFGFAGALTGIGLPEQSIPLALLFFNLGVEAGQLMFIAAVALAIPILIRLGAPGIWLKDRATPYAAGTVAAFWTLQRVAAIW